MKVDFYTSKREYEENKLEFNNAVINVMQEGISTLGKEVADFEKSVEKFTGVKHAIAVASGTDALTLASDILGFKNGKEIITSPFTFLASTSCITRGGGIPVFVDIDPESFNIDANKIEEKITKNTIGILPIHLFSQMADMDKIMSIAGSYSLKVLEDAAEAFGMRWKGNGDTFKHSGTIGDLGVFSFFPTKTLGAYGDGGMIVTNDDKLASLARMYRVHGASEKYHYDYIGYNSRLDTMQAAILQVKMRYISENIRKRETIANWYFNRLKNCKEIRFANIKGEQNPVYYVFNILIEKRDELAEYLQKNQVQFSIYYPIALHLQKCFSYLGYKNGDFPVSESISNRILALPIYPQIKEVEVDFVCETIIKFFE